MCKASGPRNQGLEASPVGEVCAGRGGWSISLNPGNPWLAVPTQNSPRAHLCMREEQLEGW